jgi:hypothetical protein
LPFVQVSWIDRWVKALVDAFSTKITRYPPEVARACPPAGAMATLKNWRLLKYRAPDRLPLRLSHAREMTWS